MQIQEKINSFLAEKSFGVAGASTNREKYGNKILRCYLQHKRNAIPINPRAEEIENIKCVASVSELTNEVKAISVITPPKITEEVVNEAIKKGIKHIWMQPGSQSQKAIDNAIANGINVIADGSCLLVVLGYNDQWEANSLS